MFIAEAVEVEIWGRKKYFEDVTDNNEYLEAHTASVVGSNEASTEGHREISDKEDNAYDEINIKQTV